MSSFKHPHFMYLFSLKSGGKKLAYGKDPQDALEVIKLRLTSEEMEQILENDYIKVKQSKLQEYVHLLK